MAASELTSTLPLIRRSRYIAERDTKHGGTVEGFQMSGSVIAVWFEENISHSHSIHCDDDVENTMHLMWFCPHVIAL